MSAQTRPTNNVEVPYTAIHNSAMATSQLQRAWCLMLTRAIWPTIDPVTAKGVAEWLMNGSPEGGAT